MNVIVMVVTTAVLAVISGILYHLGGTNAGTKWRDIGCPACMIVWMIVNGYISWWLLLASFLMFAAQTTYFKKKGTDAKWYNWAFVGLAFSISLFPIAIYNNDWTGFIVRLLCVTGFTVLWSVIISNAKWEEFGRGFIQIATIPLLFLIKRRKK